jgi:hypothetical protein
MNFEKFEEFEKNFVFNLQTENDNCIALLDNNKELIETKLGGPNNLKIIHKFVAFIKDAVLKNNGEFVLIQTILYHSSMQNVFSEFKKSTILIEACESKNTHAIEWLLTNGY